MRTDRVVTRMSSDWVATKPIVNRMTDRHLWKHYLPLAAGNKKISVVLNYWTSFDSHNFCTTIIQQSQLWVGDTEKLSKTFSHSWLVLVEFSQRIHLFILNSATVSVQTNPMFAKELFSFKESSISSIYLSWKWHSIVRDKIMFLKFKRGNIQSVTWLFLQPDNLVDGLCCIMDGCYRELPLTWLN